MLFSLGNVHPVERKYNNIITNYCFIHTHSYYVAVALH